MQWYDKSNEIIYLIEQFNVISIGQTNPSALGPSVHTTTKVAVSKIQMYNNVRGRFYLAHAQHNQ